MLLDLDDIADVVASAVKAATAPLIAENQALSARLEAVEKRKIPEAIKGDPGEVDMEAVAQLVDQAAVRIVGEKGPELVGLIPVPEAPEPLAPDMDVIRNMIEEAVSQLPERSTVISYDMEAVALMVDERVASAVKDIPVPKDGVGLASAFKDADGCLILTMTNGETRNLGPINGKDGETFTLDDFDIEQTDDRTLEFKFLRGDTMHTFELEFPVAIYRGVWTEKEYQRGDMVTWAGSVWHADKTTSAKPDTPDGGWKLAVKRGRDGKDAKP